MFFSILTRWLACRSEFNSRDELVNKIMGFVHDHNRRAKPFRRTYDGNPFKPRDNQRNFRSAAQGVIWSETREPRGVSG